eukprot:m.13300 g.13300  ORF g.13300 m.13300 type:complete len:51 (-) comp3291_c0_seq2:202-354(-)
MPSRTTIASAGSRLFGSESTSSDQKRNIVFFCSCLSPEISLPFSQTVSAG